jgi:hypothetical protein
MASDDDHANKILELELQRVDRTTHTHHCWHASKPLINSNLLGDDSVYQTCCECPQTRTARRGQTGTWEKV